MTREKTPLVPAEDLDDEDRLHELREERKKVRKELERKAHKQFKRENRDR